VAGGFSPQFLDAVLHVGNVHPDREPSAVYFAGGSVAGRLCHNQDNDQGNGRRPVTSLRLHLLTGLPPLD
jgi:hypothetical protein